MTTLFEDGAVDRARRSLMRRDPELKEWIRRIGPIEVKRRGPHFKALCRAIIAQQVSNKAATSMIAKFLALFPRPATPRPGQLLALTDDALLGAGISNQKRRYLRCLAEAFDEGGALAKARFSRMSDEQIIESLTAITGIGRWTAEMFLMFSLGRPDHYSTGDLALTNAIARLTGLSDPTPEQCLERAEPWRPHRTVACLYLWRLAHWPKNSHTESE